MKVMFQSLSCLLVLVVCTALRAQTTAPRPQDTVDVQHVIDAYHASIHDHDGDRMASLFLPEALWLNVLTDQTYAGAKEKNPNAVKVRTGSYKAFAQFVTATKANLNPTSSNRVIHTDGTIATVYFDFVFLSDGKPTNKGSESWELVKGTDGWRIASIIYSSTPVS